MTIAPQDVATAIGPLAACLSDALGEPAPADVTETLIRREIAGGELAGESGAPGLGGIGRRLLIELVVAALIQVFQPEIQMTREALVEAVQQARHRSVEIAETLGRALERETGRSVPRDELRAIVDRAIREVRRQGGAERS